MKLADYFSAISQTVDPLDETNFPPALIEVLREGRRSSAKPVLDQHQVYCKIMRVTKPKSTVAGDVPIVLLKRYPFQYAEPAKKYLIKLFKHVHGQDNGAKRKQLS